MGVVVAVSVYRASHDKHPVDCPEQNPVFACQDRGITDSAPSRKPASLSLFTRLTTKSVYPLLPLCSPTLFAFHSFVPAL